jgi:predicted RNA-binding protein with RPS1 domain
VHQAVFARQNLDECAEIEHADDRLVGVNGDKVTVKLLAIDDRGRLQLSMKAAARELKTKNQKES